MKDFIFLSLFLISGLSTHAQSDSIVPCSMFHGSERHCGIYPDKSYNTFGDVKWKFKTDGKIFSSPAILNNVAYIGSEDKNLYAVDVLSGKIKWKFKTDGAVHSSPAVYKNAVYFGSFDGYFYSVNTKTGIINWKIKTEGEKRVGEIAYWGMLPSGQYMEDPWDVFLSSPIIDIHDTVPTIYFGSSDGNIYAVTANDGAIKWKYKTSGLIHASPTLYNGIIYAGSWDTYLYAIDAVTGKLKWKFKTGDQMAMTGIQASVTAENDKVYFGARDGYMYGLNAATGELIWKYDAEKSWIISTAAIKDDVIYVGTSDSFALLALDANTGKEKFRFKTNGYVFSSPSIAGSTAFFGDFTGNMFAVDLISGGQKWNSFSTESRKKSAIQILHDDKLDFAYAAQGKDLAVYSANVFVMDQFYSLGSIVSSPVIQNGVIYFGSADGYLYAINLKVSDKDNHEHR